MLWSASRDSTLENILRLQGEVALQLADEINTVVTPEERTRIASTRSVDPEAYGLYAQGSHFLNRRDAEGFERARELFEQALAIDPTFLQARVGLADCYLMLANHGFISAEIGGARAELEVRRVLDEDPNLGEALTTLGNIQFTHHRDWKGAETSFQRALALSPNHGSAHDWYGDFLNAIGRYDEAFEYEERSLELDPLSPERAADYGMSLYWTGRTEESITYLKSAVELHPDVPMVLRTLGWMLQYSGNYGEALKYHERAARLTGMTNLQYTSHIVNVMARLGRSDEARAVLNEILEQYQRSGVGSPTVIADSYSELGDLDKAFEWYEEAFKKNDPELIWLRMGESIWLQPDFVADPRYENLIERLNYPD